MKISFFVSREHRLIFDQLETFRSRQDMSHEQESGGEESSNNLGEGRKSFRSGNYQNADRFLTAAIEGDRTNAIYFYIRAVIRHALHDPQKDPIDDVQEGARLELQQDRDSFAKSFGDALENVQGKHRIWMENQRLRAKTRLVSVRGAVPAVGVLERERRNFLEDSKAIQRLKSCLRKKYHNIHSLLKNDRAIVLNFRYVDEETIKKYFQLHPNEHIRSTMGPKMNNVRILNNWCMNISRILLRNGYMCDEITKDRVIHACDMLFKSREVFGSIELFKGHVLYIAGDEKISDWPDFQSDDPAVIKKRDDTIRIAGEYRYGINPVRNGIEKRAGKENFDFIRITEEERDHARKKMFNIIETQESILRLILDGDSDGYRFYPNPKSRQGAFTVDELVDAFVKRYRGPYGKKMEKKYNDGPFSYLPIGLAQEEVGQAAGQEFLGLNFFKKVFRIGKKKTTIADVVSVDEGDRVPEGFAHNLFLTVPDIPVVPEEVDMIFFIHCRGPDFQATFNRRLRERMGGRGDIPIVRTDPRQRYGDQERGLV